jgi:hypothetical protein
MPRVIQIRDVPDDVHDELSAVARDEGLSLTRFVRRELEQVAARRRRAEHNARVLRDAQEQIATRVDRKTILDALHEGRGE